MNRTFHQQFNYHGLVVLLLLAALALWCFLSRQGMLPLVGLCCLLLGATVVDRLVNTTYVFTSDGMLTISHGRLGRKLVIPVVQIVKITRRPASLFTASHLVIEYGISRITYAQPSDQKGFIEEVKRRQDEKSL